MQKGRHLWATSGKSTESKVTAILDSDRKLHGVVTGKQGDTVSPEWAQANGETIGISFTDSEGYTFYLSDLGLVNRSAYSVSVNPGVHLFYQVLYCCIGNQRGFNVRFVMPYSVTNVVRNALVAGYAHFGDQRWRVLWATRGKANKSKELMRAQLLENSGDVGEEVGADQAPVPTDIDPVSWVTYYELMNGKLGKSFRDFVAQIKHHCRDSRPGTVGEYLYETIIQHLHYFSVQ